MIDSILLDLRKNKDHTQLYWLALADFHIARTTAAMGLWTSSFHCLKTLRYTIPMKLLVTWTF